MPINNFKFLIVGTGRGGTSLLSGLLDYHSQLEVAYELYAEEYLIGKAVPYQGAGLFDVRVNSFIDACQNTVRNKPDSFWGNKIKTEQIYGLEDHNFINPDFKLDILDEFFNKHLKDIKVIFILRDGRTCINSKLNRYEFKSEKRTMTGIPIQRATERWQYSVACYKFFKTRHFNSCCVKFEDILLHPHEMVKHICEFLNIPYEEQMLLGTDNEKMIPSYRKKYFDQSKMQITDLPEHILVQIEQDLKYCEYI